MSIGAGTGGVTGFGLIGLPVTNQGALSASGGVLVLGKALIGSGAVNVEANAALVLGGGGSISGPLTNNGLVQVVGGTFTVNGTQRHGLGAALEANGAVARLNTDAGGLDPNWWFHLSASAVGPGAAVQFGATQHLAALNLTGGGQGKLLSGGQRVLVTKALSIDPNDSRLDVTNNDLIVDYAPAESSPVEAVKEWITAGFNYGSWDGFGITTGYINSPDPGGDPNDAGDMYTRGVGYMQNDQCLYGPYSEFSGQAVDDSTVLVKYTRLGDLNLDGVVNDMDVTVLGLYYDYDPNTGEHPLGPIWHWWEGDLNYDGYVDDVDVTLLGLNYDVEAAPLSDSPTSIPEPGTLCLLALGALCGWARQPRIWRVAAATNARAPRA
jgi:hypothetical protein